MDLLSGSGVIIVRLMQRASNNRGGKKVKSNVQEMLETQVYQQFIANVEIREDSYYKDLVIDKNFSSIIYTIRIQEEAACLIMDEGLILLYNVEWFHIPGSG